MVSAKAGNQRKIASIFSWMKMVQNPSLTHKWLGTTLNSFVVVQGTKVKLQPCLCFRGCGWDDDACDAWDDWWWWWWWCLRWWCLCFWGYGWGCVRCKAPCRKGCEDSLLSWHGSHIWVCITFCKVRHGDMSAHQIIIIIIKKHENSGILPALVGWQKYKLDNLDTYILRFICRNIEAGISWLPTSCQFGKMLESGSWISASVPAS